MNALRVWMDGYSNDKKKNKKDTRVEPVKKALARIDAEIEKLQKQLEKTFELLEQEVYDLTLFQTRRAAIEKHLEEQRTKKEEWEAQLANLDAEQLRRSTIVPKIQTLFDAYDTLTAEEKHHLYKEILSKITYHKDPKTKEISVEIYPRV